MLLSFRVRGSKLVVLILVKQIIYFFRIEN